MRFAIPTYKRASLIANLTLGYLQRCGVKDYEIDLFVSNDMPELVEYRRALGNRNSLTFINCVVDNVRDKFNYIHSYYPEGTCVAVMEDDLTAIKRKIGYNKLEEELNIEQECIKAFNLMTEEKIFLCGINSNSNPFFMEENKISRGFKFVVANMYMFIQTDPPVLITQHSKTDYERTILYFERFNNLMRLDYLCPITKNYTIAGGMQEIGREKREQIEQESVNYLTTTYPHLCKPNTSKKSLFAEMSLLTMKHLPEKKSAFAAELFKNLK